jgi:hypothetical protein
MVKKIKRKIGDRVIRSKDLVKGNYKSPEDLAELGPLIRGNCVVTPGQLAGEIGRTKPTRVEGCFLIDTGATTTSIALAVAEELGLLQTGLKHGMGAGGAHVNPVFMVLVEIPIVTVAKPKNIASTISHQGECQGIPGLDKCLADRGLIQDGQSQRVIGLLGRDILRHTTFIYFGTEGRLELLVDRKSFTAPPPG